MQPDPTAPRPPATATGAAPPAPRRRSRALTALVYVLYLWGLVELASWAGLWALQRYKGVEYTPAQIQGLIDKHVVGIERHLDEQHSDDARLATGKSYMVMDPELGWVVGKSRSVRGYHSDSAGIRADREYAPWPPAGVLRIAAFGDSFTHASDVPNSAAWETRLEASAPNLEVLNFGVPGYGPDQAFLRYRRDGVAFHPHVVFIGFMSENVGRVVNAFRPFYFPRSGMAFGKPRFGVEGDRLVLYPNPLPREEDYRRLLADPAHELRRVGVHDYYYQNRSQRWRLDFLPSVRMAWVLRERFRQPMTIGGVYNPRWEGFQVSVRLVTQFYREALQHGSLPVVVLFPERGDFVDRRDGKPLLYATLLDAFRKQGLTTLDLMTGFDRYDPQHAMLHKKFVHYPAEGNAIVARYVADWLREQGLGSPQAAQQRIAAERRRFGV